MTLAAPRPLESFRKAAADAEINAALAGVWVDGEPIRDVHFKTGNVTQSMTATILLQVVDEGEVELDDPVFDSCGCRYSTSRWRHLGQPTIAMRQL